MIEERTQYRVKCDGCGRPVRPAIYDEWFSIDPARAERIAQGCGWTIDMGRHFCPECKKEAGKS